MLVRVIREPDPVVINIFTIPDPELVLKALLEAHEIFQTFYTRPSKVCYFLMIKLYYFLAGVSHTEEGGVSCCGWGQL